jgi:hypothetical protein
MKEPGVTAAATAAALAAQWQQLLYLCAASVQRAIGAAVLAAGDGGACWPH